MQIFHYLIFDKNQMGWFFFETIDNNNSSLSLNRNIINRVFIEKFSSKEIFFKKKRGLIVGENPPQNMTIVVWKILA